MFWWYAVCEGMQHRCDWSTATCTPLPWLQGRPSSSLSLQLQPRAGGFLGDDGDKTFEMSLDTFESEKHKQNMKIDEQCRLQWPYVIRIHPQGHLQFTSTSMQGHNTTQYESELTCSTTMATRNRPANATNLPSNSSPVTTSKLTFRGSSGLAASYARMVEDGYEWLIHRSPVFPTEHSSSSLSISVAEFRSFTAYPSFWCRKQMSCSHLLSSDKLIRLFRKSHSVPSSNKEFINI